MIRQILAQDISARTGGMKFVVADFEGGTHCSADQLRLTAIAGSVAFLHTAEQVITHPGTIRAQRFVHPRGIDDLMRIEDITAVPAVFDLSHEFVGLLAVLQGDELATQSSVAVFTADGASMLAYQEGRLPCDTPEERVPQYQSHFWLRAIVSEKDQTVENWNILVRDFPMENLSFFGMPAVIGVIISGFSLVFGLLLLILFLQKRRQKRNEDNSGI